ncbi:MAG: carbohydrate-binding family 9-like protein [Planctomycetes bacterium]|nr:carbohydrate-binding family 9-like protein [Planctomycetota bacterium]
MNHLPVLEVHRTRDFDVTGLGDHRAWSKIEPIDMTCRERVKRGEKCATWFKALWSTRGIYFFVDCTDERLSATRQPDFAPLFQQDVVEVFLWPSETLPIYFEYNISPFGSELPILCPHVGREYMPWQAWNYHGKRRVRKAVNVRGGTAEPGAVITGWSAEFFIPAALLHPLPNRKPARGVEWRANVYRIDYDRKPTRHFTWKDVGPSFHNHHLYPTLLFV